VIRVLIAEEMHMIRGALIALLTLEDDLDTPDPCNPLHRYVTRFGTCWASANDGADVSHGCAGCGGYRVDGKPEGRVARSPPPTVVVAISDLTVPAGRGALDIA
jgi:hypothetical protein